MSESTKSSVVEVDGEGEKVSSDAATAEEKCNKKPFEVTITIPFESQRHASIIVKSLVVDLAHETNRMRTGITKEITNCDNEIQIRYTTTNLKALRVNVNSILEHIILLIDTIDNFDYIWREEKSCVKSSDKSSSTDNTGEKLKLKSNEEKEDVVNNSTTDQESTTSNPELLVTNQ